MESDQTCLAAFAPATRDWFQRSFPEPTAVQTAGWHCIQQRKHCLLAAPTGSGKTLAAMLWGIDRSMRAEKVTDSGHKTEATDKPGVRVLYISPLKALVYDIERNLRSPLVGIQRSAERLELPHRTIRADVRTGDTPQKERVQQRKRPGEILVTTPESLFLILGSAARENLRSVETVIVDEVHALCGTKRGVHLALSLERLSELCERDPQRIGLSATVHPIEDAAEFLAGDRPVQVVDVSAKPRLEIEVKVPVADMETAARAWHPSHADRKDRHIQAPTASSSAVEFDGPINLSRAISEPDASNTEETPRSQAQHGLWPTIHPELVRLIRENNSTILFVQSRSLCERLAQAINELAEEELVRAHHGSVAPPQRKEIEEALKAGKLPGIVATSSLELGIDMGAVDMVLMVESPGSVARGLQRVGRAGHSVGEVSRGILFPKFRGDLVECAAIAERMLTGQLESVSCPKNALDVLAQQLVAMVCDRDRPVDELAQLVRRSAPYRSLARSVFDAVLDMLSGRYPSDDFADLRPRLAWDRNLNVLTARAGSPMLTRLNAGTIPDRGLFAVHMGEGGPRVGELDEEMVYETRRGDVILLGASSWRVQEITRDRVLVEPAPGESGRLPFWRGDGLGRPIELGRSMGVLLRRLESLCSSILQASNGQASDSALEDAMAQAIAELRRELPLDENAAGNLIDYVGDQLQHAGAVPTDHQILVERFRDEMGDWRVCILTPFGARLHAPWALALQTTLSARSGFEVSTVYTDDGIALSFAADIEDSGLPTLEELFPEPEQLEELVRDQLNGSALFGSHFRENAARALLLPRRNPRARTPLWAQRLKAKALLGTVQRFSDFPIVLETYRQCLQDVFDLPALAQLLRQVERGEIRVESLQTQSASPFARSLVYSWVAAYMYEYDAPLAERRVQALHLDTELLRELLGEAELRELLDADVVELVAGELQRTTLKRQARNPDELHDVLRTLGALSQPELQLRFQGSEQELEAALQRLQTQRRCVRVRLKASQPLGHWLASQDAGLYRDGLGCALPGGLGEADLASVPDGLERLILRYARHSIPFRASQLAEHLELNLNRVLPYLERQRANGQLTRGALLPLALQPAKSKATEHEPEWCNTEVLRQLKRRTLAKLRGSVAPVEAAALARFLPQWQGLMRASDAQATFSGNRKLLEAIQQLEGIALPWSVWNAEILPARVPQYRPEQLDQLSTQGELVWIGRGSSGPRDGNLILLTRATAERWLEPALEQEQRSEPAEDTTSNEESQASLSEAASQLLDLLSQRGALFTTELLRKMRSTPTQIDSSAPTTQRAEAEIEAALWELVWAGLVTNDTFQPLLSLSQPNRRKRPTASRSTSLRTQRGFQTRPELGRRSPSRAPLSGGRWSLVQDLSDPACSPTQRAHTRALLLLERYGVVSRETAKAEEMPGGFSSLYKVLSAMEEAGRVRRGHFVAGLSGAQFALPGAVDRLRSESDQSATVPSSLRKHSSMPSPTRKHQETPDTQGVHSLAAQDPANPWGSILAWPPLDGPASLDNTANTDSPRNLRPRRSRGARLYTVEGQPALWLSPDSKSLLVWPLPAESIDRALRALGQRYSGGDARWHASSKRGASMLSIQKINGQPARGSSLAPQLEAQGFVLDYQGWVLKEPFGA